MDLRVDPRHALLNDWQRDFPLCEAPFARIGNALGLGEAEVIGHYEQLALQGALSRIGGAFAAGAGGAGLLAAMAVPPQRLLAVAARVSAHPGVNHNYQREHAWNLWFVINGSGTAAVHRAVDGLEVATGLATLRLPMCRAYRIDLGFDLGRRVGHTNTCTRGEAPAPVPVGERALAALVEGGLPLLPRPYAAWARQLGGSAQAVTDTLARWQHDGTLRRFGVVVRHHELGYAANAMTVFDVPDDEVDARGAALAREAGVTLAYRRERATDWPYNLYCMVHGRDREAVREMLHGVIERAGLQACRREVLFSCRRFKQEGARRFRALEQDAAVHEC
jgi:siroheme decarboxylase